MFIDVFYCYNAIIFGIIWSSLTSFLTLYTSTSFFCTYPPSPTLLLSCSQSLSSISENKSFDPLSLTLTLEVRFLGLYNMYVSYDARTIISINASGHRTLSPLPILGIESTRDDKQLSKECSKSMIVWWLSIVPNELIVVISISFSLWWCHFAPELRLLSSFLGDPL